MHVGRALYGTGGCGRESCTKGRVGERVARDGVGEEDVGGRVCGRGERGKRVVERRV